MVDPILQVWRLGCLDAWMPGCQQARGLQAWILDPWRVVGLLAGWQDWIGLDVGGCWIGGSGGIGGFPALSHA